MRTTGSNRKYNQEDKIKQRSHILQRYVNYTGNKILPEDKEFWTLGNKVISDDGDYINNSEYDFFIKNNFIKPNQYFSIDYDDKITRQNKGLDQANFFTGWFHEVIKSKTKNKNFNPGIMFFDTTCMPRNSVDDFFDVIVYLLKRNVKECMFVYNVCLMAKGNSSSPEIVNKLLSKHCLNSVLRYVSYDPESYTYGNGKCSLMHTLFFYL